MNNNMGSLELAYIGDALYELYIREKILNSGAKVKELHKLTVSFVNAKAQSKSVHAMLSILTPDEEAVVKRARNCKQTPTKNADITDYHYATALEALFGYLYLNGNKERLNTLLEMAYNAAEEK